MIIVTGAAGFIGSCLISKLNKENFNNLIAVDDFSNKTKNKNLDGKNLLNKVNRLEFFKWLKGNYKDAEFIFHIGARTDTTETNKSIFDELNLNYSRDIWAICAKHNIPLIYASSAATYGNGDNGYDDKHDIINYLKPLNFYGESKNEFDKFVIKQKDCPPFWAGLKFFNVYGPNEYPKGRMASVVFHAFNQIKESGYANLFRSYNSSYKDGWQKRDFIYVKDVVDVCYFFMNNQNNSGIYNVGTGKARTFFDLVSSVFSSLGKKPNIEFIDMPEEIRKNYQYFTEANMTKLRSIGYTKEFFSLEDGIKDYVINYLVKNEYY